MRSLFVLVSVVLLALAGCKGETPPTPSNTNMLKPPGKKIVVYDFWAPWCPPCRAFGPTFDKWKGKHSNENISFVKVNTDEDEAMASKFKIASLPTIVVTHDGIEVKRFVGAPLEQQLLEFLK
jgi:thioredoxin 2